jgi:peptide/nickel transport system substrate-binding protein
VRARGQPAGRPPLVVTGPWEIGGLAPARSGHVFQRMQVAETLTGVAEDGTPAPGLAERWTVSTDGLRWRFELRRGVRFHDGAPLDAQAVVRSRCPRSRRSTRSARRPTARSRSA